MHCTEASTTHNDQLAAQHSGRAHDLSGRLAHCLMQPVSGAGQVKQRSRLARCLFGLLAAPLVEQFAIGGEQIVQKGRSGSDMHEVNLYFAQPVFPTQQVVYGAGRVR
jgi:hypothetical protein